MTYSDCIDWIDGHSLVCPMKKLTGIDCPGCGMQRAVLSLLRGDVAESIHFHPAAIPTLFMLVFLILHLKFRFAHGAAILKWTFILAATITMINYAFKLYNYGHT